MALIDYSDSAELLTIFLKGHIDSANAGTVEQEIQEVLRQSETEGLVLDAADLGYISSAGLRVVLRLRKQLPSARSP